jgi:hypothetical protein
MFYGWIDGAVDGNTEVAGLFEAPHRGRGCSNLGTAGSRLERSTATVSWSKHPVELQEILSQTTEKTVKQRV